MNLNELIDGHVNGGLGAGQTAELSRALEDSPEARREFLLRIRVHAALIEHFSDDGDADYQPFEPRRSNHLRATKLIWAAAAIATLAVFWWPRQAAPIAEIVSSESAEWGKPVGSTLNSGRLLLLHGMVELKIGHSVRVAIEAPADFELIDKTRMRLRSGLVAADVDEPGRGFTIVTPEGEVIDLGARFGVRVGGDGAWSDSSNWRGGGRPDPARSRVIIEGVGEAAIDGRIATKQSVWITSGKDSTGRLRIAKNGELIKSGFGELVVGVNLGGRAELKIQGSLKTRCPVFIGRNTATTPSRSSRSTASCVLSRRRPSSGWAATSGPPSSC